MRRGRPKSDSSVAISAKVRALYRDGFSSRSIASTLGLSVSYVSRLLRSLKVSDPSLVNSFLLSRDGSDSGIVEGRNVHAQRIRCYVHWSKPSYDTFSTSYFKDFVDGVDVSCQGKYIYLRSTGKKFKGESESKALWNSLGFWRDVISRLENRLGVMIFKKGCRAFDFVYSEWETRDSSVAMDAERRGYVWRVFHTEDGKLRLTVDWSDGSPNHETHHKRDAHVDSIVFNSHVNSILDNPQAPTFAQLSSVIRDIVVVNRDTAQGLSTVVDVMKSQFVKGADGVSDDFVVGVPFYVG